VSAEAADVIFSARVLQKLFVFVQFAQFILKMCNVETVKSNFILKSFFWWMGGDYLKSGDIKFMYVVVYLNLSLECWDVEDTKRGFDSVYLILFLLNTRFV